MRHVWNILVLGLCLAAVDAARGQATNEWIIQPLSTNGEAWLNYEDGQAGGINGVMVQYPQQEHR